MDTTTEKNLIARASVTINAPVSKVWEALTSPHLIKQYLFGTEAESGWKKGSPVFFRGEWEGKKYEDKGTIINIVPEKQLHHTYWSSMSNLEDKPENYKNVMYDLSEEKGQTIVRLTQDNNSTQEGKEHAEENWRKVLEGLKKILESK